MFSLPFQHLVVINIDNEVIGMITRKEIAALEPEFTPFPKSKITLYKKTSIINHRRTIENKRNGVRRRKVTLTNSDSYRRFYSWNWLIKITIIVRKIDLSIIQHAILLTMNKSRLQFVFLLTSSGCVSMGSAELMNSQKGVLKPMNFSMLQL